jgi:hypothetical protein
VSAVDVDRPLLEQGHTSDSGGGVRWTGSLEILIALHIIVPAALDRWLRNDFSTRWPIIRKGDEVSGGQA